VIRAAIEGSAYLLSRDRWKVKEQRVILVHKSLPPRDRAASVRGSAAHLATRARRRGDRMKRREFLTLLGTTGIVWPQVARAANTVPTIGILWHGGSPAEEGILFDSMKQGFADLGYLAGQNIVFEDRFPGEAPGAFENFANELVRLKVDVLVAVSVPSVLAAQKATSTIPIVFLPIVDPVALKLVSSLAHPGGNLTGLSTMGVDIAGKRVQLMRDMFPGLAKVALMFDPVVPYNIVREIAESKLAGQQLGISVEEFEAHEPENIDPIFSKFLNMLLKRL
jgi:putative ABC transport system substrate-binding protein